MDNYTKRRKYNKLVRDKVPQIIKGNGGLPIIHIADEKEYWDKLKLKLQEEITEFLEKENAEELADVLEVVYAMGDFLKVSRKELETVRKRKAQQRGGFKERVILEES